MGEHGAGDRGRGSTHWSWRIGSLCGIDVFVHATFLILLAWVAFSHIAQGHGLSPAVDGLALVLAIFGVVVLHELGHALTARRFGIRTRDITLFPFGGIASLERMPEQPTQELLVALAGPAVNLALAAALGAILAATGGALEMGDMHLVGGSFLTKLVWINLSLAVFNLLPAFPMDGGRVLRALLAFRLPYARATELAATIGQGMALVFGILGLFTNPMLLIIAFFVWMGAQQESSLVQVRSALAGLSIESAMITDFKTIAPTEPLARAAEVVLAGFQHDFPVVDDGRLVGVLTRDDIMKGLADGGPATPVGHLMRTHVATAEATDMLEGALARLGEDEAASIIVVEDGRVRGMLTPENIGELVLVQRALRSNRRSAAAPRR